MNPHPDPSPVTTPTPVSLASGVGSGTVLTVIGDDVLATRLVAAGFWPGAFCERVTTSPLGDPILFLVHGYRVALRRAEAARVLVQPEPNG